MTEKTIALIVATGRGERLKAAGFFSEPKQYLTLGHSSIIRYTVTVFLNHPKIDNVICVIHEDDVELYKESILGLDLLNPVFGGKRRQDSVRKGLEAIKDLKASKILIHDAVRPFVSKLIIDSVLDKLQDNRAVIPAIPVDDTIKKYGDGKIRWTVERHNLWRAQTPQGFIYEDILNAHNAFKNNYFTDDAEVDEYAGIPVAIIPGSQNNFKITTMDDYERAKRIVSMNYKNIIEEVRIGNGYDIHEIIDNKDNEFIRLGGVDILFKGKKILAHSDGDVILHAVTDALIGASSMGDIGELFPNNDNKFKDIDSRLILSEIFKILRRKEIKIINIDITVICEKPKLLQYKSKIKESIAKILDLENDRVNIKAKTNEGLDAIGKNKAIACYATSSIIYKKYRN